MNRREFLVSTSAAGLAAATAASPAPAQAPAASQPVLMKLGDQTEPTNETHLKYLARYGVRNICGYPQIEGDRLYATVDELKRMVDMAGKYGISIDCIAPPFLASSYIDQEKHPAIMLAAKPGARPRHRAAADADPQLRAGRHSVHQVQHEHPGRAAHRPRARPRRRLYSHGSYPKRIPQRRSPAPGVVTPTPSGSASLISSTASFPSPTSTRSAWPAIRRIPAFRPKATRA